MTTRTPDESTGQVHVEGYRLRRDEHPVLINGVPRERRRIGDEPSDWSSGPTAEVHLACGHVRHYRPPSPAKGDWITCGCCGLATLVRRPIRRMDRHASPLTYEDIYGMDASNQPVTP